MSFTFGLLVVLIFNNLGILKTKFVFAILLFLQISWLQAQDDLSEKMVSLKKLSIEELLNIEVVTASKSEQPVHEAPSTMSVVTSEQIVERGYEELDDAIRDIVGVDAVHASGGFPVI